MCAWYVAGVQKAWLSVALEEVELWKDRVCAVTQRTPALGLVGLWGGVPERSSSGGREPVLRGVWDVGGLAEAAAASGELHTAGHWLLPLKPYRGDRFCRWAMSASRATFPRAGQAEAGAASSPSWGEGDGLSVSAQRSGRIAEGRDSPVPSHICCPRALLSRWKRCW